jgi:hypothetical protein
MATKWIQKRVRLGKEMLERYLNSNSNKRGLENEKERPATVNTKSDLQL